MDQNDIEKIIDEFSKEKSYVKKHNDMMLDISVVGDEVTVSCFSDIVNMVSRKFDKTIIINDIEDKEKVHDALYPILKGLNI